MKIYYEMGLRNFYFFDDTFNTSKKRVIELSRAITSNGMQNINWVFRGRIDVISDEMIREAKSSGLRQALFGVEDYKDDGLKAIKKNITIQEVRESLAICKRNGVLTSTNWILGLPSHKSRKDILDMYEEVVSLDPDYAMFTVLSLLPSTELFNEAVKECVIEKDYWIKHILDPKPSLVIKPFDKYLGVADLSWALQHCYTRFYSRPRYLIKRLLKVKSWSDLALKARVAIRIFSPSAITKN
jgi:radical SAM superfamily enzyme YgiQ (UPF0313 family)